MRCSEHQFFFRAFFIFMTYKEQLKDPRWQRVQSAIRERDNYKCRLCGDTTTFLHVHHLYYTPKLKAWEYDTEALVTLCEECHDFAHDSLPKIITLMSIAVLRDGVTLIDVYEFLNSQFKNK